MGNVTITSSVKEGTTTTLEVQGDIIPVYGGRDRKVSSNWGYQAN